MMRAITLYEPYATGMAFNLKRNETRGRKTNVRGELAICSVKGRQGFFFLPEAAEAAVRAQLKLCIDNKRQTKQDFGT